MTTYTIYFGDAQVPIILDDGVFRVSGAITNAAEAAALVAQGTTAPTKVMMVGGKSNDGTAQYKELPLGASARSVIVEGHASGTAVPVSLATAPALVTGTATIGATKDAGPSQTITRTGFASADASSTPVDLTTAPTAKAVAMDVIISVAVACTVNINTETTGLLFSIYMAANSTVQLTPRGYIKGATAAKKLQITTSVTSAISGLCVWFEEA